MTPLRWAWYVDVACVLVLGVVWLVGAPMSRRTIRHESWRSRLQYLLPAGCATVIVIVARSTTGGIAVLQHRVVPDILPIALLSVALTASGVAFAIWARLTLGRLWSGTVTLKQGHTVVQRGPYAITRHPIYTGFIVASAGVVLAERSVAALCVPLIVIVVFAFKLRSEENLLRGEFGSVYDEYRRRVPALVPRLRRR